jgi:peptidoglycan/LPS O-acetylase OafA/YrhL
MGAKPTKAGRLAYVDGLRALAALEVVASHIAATVSPTEPNRPTALASALVTPLSYGHTAVSVFIVLSGFCLALPIVRAGWRIPGGALGFYKRRARRILPPYYLGLALSLLLIWLFIGQKTGTHWDVALPVTWRSVLDHLTLTQDVLGDATINHAYWSIAVECHIYILFPALILLWRRYHPAFAAAVVVAFSLLLTFALMLTGTSILGYLASSVAPQYLGLFAMGMLAAWLVEHDTRLPGWRLWVIGLVGVACWVAVIALLTHQTIATFLLSDYAAGIGTIAILVLASRGTRYNPLAWRPLVWVGGFSYSLYLIHAPLVQVIWQYFIHPMGLSGIAAYLALLLGGLPPILLAAWGFWYACERTFMTSHAPKVPNRSGLNVPSGSATVYTISSARRSLRTTSPT